MPGLEDTLRPLARHAHWAIAFAVCDGNMPISQVAAKQTRLQLAIVRLCPEGLTAIRVCIMRRTLAHLASLDAPDTEVWFYF